jgi:hypothetical protein
MYDCNYRRTKSAGPTCCGSAAAECGGPAAAKHRVTREEEIMTDKLEEKTQPDLAARAMATKEAGAQPPRHPQADDQADEGFKSDPRPDYPPSGAFEAEGHRPVLERSRKVR